jgi:pimeloyl-ACP methyl ester carboxylesterase
MGIGMQMIGWEEEFCAKLAARGFRVIRFDNRDVGRSSWLDEAGEPDVLDVWERLRKRKPIRAAYLLSDMAADAVGLMDALGLARARIVGLSMGGMIAQEIAIRHPERVEMLVSIMSNTGEPDVQGPSYEIWTELLRPFPPERDGFITRSLQLARVISGHDLDESRVRQLAARSFDRGYHPAGVKRQLVAIWLSGGRRAELKRLTIPSLVIHGDADPLIPIDGGRDTAQSIPNARLLVIPKMGHALPRSVWPQVLDAIAARDR